MSIEPSQILPPSLVSKGNCATTRPPKSDQLREEIRTRIDALIAEVEGQSKEAETSTFKAFEQALIPRVFELGRLFITLFLCLCEEREPALQVNARNEVTVNGKKFKQRPAQPRNLADDVPVRGLVLARQRTGLAAARRRPHDPFHPPGRRQPPDPRGPGSGTR